MAITVIKPGRRPQDLIIHATCSNCACEFTFQGSDATLTHDARDGDYYTVPCPTCHGPVIRAAQGAITFGVNGKE